MKKFCIIFLLSIIISLTALGFSGNLGGSGFGLNGGSAFDGDSNNYTQEYLRIHIRADSNEDNAQAVKYLVRDELVDYLTPLVAEYQTQAEAKRGVEAHLSDIERACDSVLARNGFGYGAKASVKTEKFPTRVYEGYTLPAGEYTALIIQLGRGEGDNWWCVVYPPLCFTAPTTGKNVVYKSKIAEIISNWRG